MSITRLSTTLNGPAGDAVRVLNEPGHPSSRTTIATWWLDCPGQSPGWSSYVLSMVHLRDDPEFPPVHFLVPGATHELILCAVEPKSQIFDQRSWVMLHPFNFIAQVILPSDDTAERLAAAAVGLVLDGVLWAEPPLSGQREPWVSVLEMLVTAFVAAGGGTDATTANP